MDDLRGSDIQKAKIKKYKRLGFFGLLFFFVHKIHSLACLFLALSLLVGAYKTFPLHSYGAEK